MKVVRVLPAHLTRILAALDAIAGDPGATRRLSVTLTRFANLLRPDVAAQPNDVKMRVNLSFYGALREHLAGAPDTAKWHVDTVIQALDYFDTLDGETP